MRILCFYCDNCQDKIRNNTETSVATLLNNMKKEIMGEIKRVVLFEAMERQCSKFDALETEMKHLSDEVQEISKAQDEMFKGMQPKLDQIENKMDRVKLDETVPQSFAGAVCNKIPLVVKPKIVGQTLDTTKCDLLQNVNPSNENITIQCVKSTSKGGMVLNCSTKEDAKKFKQIMTDKFPEKYEVNNLSGFQHRIRISGITEKHSEQMMVKLLKQQNQTLLQQENDLKVLTIKSLKNKPNIFQSVIQVGPITYQRIMENGSVFIGYDCCRVFDGLEIRRCFKCCGYHHLASKCENEVICPRCAKNHELKSCKEATLMCANCVRFNVKASKKLDTNHAAWDYQCPFYKQKLEELKEQMFK